MMAATLNKQPTPLPAGWESRLDARTGRLYFINHADHTTSWEDPRMKIKAGQEENIPLQGTYAGYYLYGIGRPPGTPSNKAHTIKYHASPKANNKILQGGFTAYYGSPRMIRQGFYPHTAFNGDSNNSPRPLYKGGVIPFYGSPRTSPKVAPKDMSAVLKVDEKIAGKICMQFPTVDEGYIRKLLKKYKNRSNVVASALMSEGHPRAPTHSTPELPVKTATQGTVKVDTKLALKLRTIFPTVDEDWLYNLLSRHNNSEEDVVASLVSAGYPFTQHPFQNSGSRSSTGQSSPKMKLRYLKGIFPQVDEDVLFDVLNNCDNQTQDSIARLQNMGYKKRDSPIAKSASKDAAEESKPKLQQPTFSYPVAIDKVKVKRNLTAEFKEVSEMLVTMALESTKYDEVKARQLLQAMTPQDSVSRPLVQPTEETMKSLTEELRLSSVKKTSGDADSSTSSSLPSQSYSVEKFPFDSGRMSQSRRSSESVGSPKPPPRTKGISDVKRLSHDLQTTAEENVYHVSDYASPYRTLAKGPDHTLRKGPDPSLLGSKHVTANGPSYLNSRGANPTLYNGPNRSNLNYGGSKLANGPQKINYQGSNHHRLQESGSCGASSNSGSGLMSTLQQVVCNGVPSFV